MNEQVYFAGGYYAIFGKTDEVEFDIVRGGSSDLPYLTKNAKGLRSTSHHANLYQLSEDGMTATVVDIRCPSVGSGKHTIVLSLDHQQIIKEAIARENFFD